jgi:hypothetical protein
MAWQGVDGDRGWEEGVRNESNGEGRDSQTDRQEGMESNMEALDKLTAAPGSKEHGTVLFSVQPNGKGRCPVGAVLYPVRGMPQPSRSLRNKNFLIRAIVGLLAYRDPL